MTTAAENELLTRVGAGAPMGALMRHFGDDVSEKHVSRRCRRPAKNINRGSRQFWQKSDWPTSVAPPYLKGGGEPPLNRTI